MTRLILLLLVSNPPAPVLGWVESAPVRAEYTEGDGFFGDVLNQLPDGRAKWYFLPDGRKDWTTTAHEAHHCVNNRVGNRHGITGIYLGGGRAVRLRNPRILKSWVSEYVPPDLRGNMYRTYVAGQLGWEQTPLYLLDEWSCYITDARVALENQDQRQLGAKTTSVASCLSMAAIGAALCRAIQQYDPGYFSRSPEFLPTVGWMMRESFELYDLGLQVPSLNWDGGEFRRKLMVSELAPTVRLLTEQLP